jgi:hypothetical protein
MQEVLFQTSLALSIEYDRIDSIFYRITRLYGDFLISFGSLFSPWRIYLARYFVAVTKTYVHLSKELLVDGTFRNSPVARTLTSDLPLYHADALFDSTDGTVSFLLAYLDVMMRREWRHDKRRNIFPSKVDPNSVIIKF